MSQHRLLSKRKFLPLFLTQFCGAFNDNFLKNALVILVTYRSATVMGMSAAEIVAVAGGIFILPFFLFSALAGQVADKFEKTTVVRWIKLVEIAIMVLAAAGLIGGHFEFLLAVLFLMGLHSTFFGPIKYSILPQHLDPTEIVAGNALIEAGTFMAILMGTIAGGVLITGISGPWIVSVGLIFVAVIGYITSRSIPRAAAVAPELTLQWSPIGPTIDMIRFAYQERSVFLSVMGISWFWFFGAAVLSMFPSLCKDVLKSDETLVTVFLATFSIGVAAGSLLCERLSRDRLELGLVPLGSIGISFFGGLLYWFFGSQARYLENLQGPPIHGILFFLQSPFGLLILTALFFLSVFSGFFIVPLYTLMQERSEPRLRSRVIAANNIINALFMVVASGFLVFLFRAGLTIPQVFLILAVQNAVVAIYIYSLLPEFFLRFLMWIVSQLLYRLSVKGLANVPKTGAAVLVCNHVSFIDWLIIGAAVKRPVRFVMDHSFFKGRFLKTIMTQAKVIPIASMKENPATLESAFSKVRAELEAGELVCIFPEGRITSDGELSPLRPGLLRILNETPVLVVPMGLNGFWGSLFSRKDKRLKDKRPRRFWSRVELQIGPAIEPVDVSLETLTAEILRLRPKT
jgi:1-acyl-sn-glycerol-3-phosphate acyltransferase